MSLPFFRSPNQKNHQCLTVNAVVDTVSRANVEPKLKNAFAYSFVIAKIPKFDTVNARLNARSRLGMLAPEPFVKVVRTIFRNIVDYSHH